MRVGGVRPAAGPRGALLLLLALHVACGPSAQPDARSGPPLSGRFSLDPLDALLKRHVRGGLVDYGALRADPDFARCLTLFGEADPAQLPGRSDRLAFWIDAYNLMALKEVADSYPVGSIREIGVLGRFTFMRGLHFRAGSRDCTLDGILHKTLRPDFHEPRVHFAIVSASLGSPRLRSSAYHPETLEEELEEAAREFILDPSRVRLDRDQGVLHLSPIFDWFGEDFDRAAGSRVEFVRRYLQREDADYLGRGKVSVRYLDFDWSLNDLHPAGRG